jgi:hypothetical protein
MTALENIFVISRLANLPMMSFHYQTLIMPTQIMPTEIIPRMILLTMILRTVKILTQAWARKNIPTNFHQRL